MLETVQKSELFRGVTEAVLMEIAGESVEESFAEGDNIFDAGQYAEHIFELVEGSVDLIMLEKEIVHLTVSKAGQIFGWSALVEPYQRTATARCTSPTRVIRMSRGSIESIMENHPREGLAIMKNLTRLIAGRLREAYTYIYYYA